MGIIGMVTGKYIIDKFKESRGNFISLMQIGAFKKRDYKKRKVY